MCEEHVGHFSVEAKVVAVSLVDLVLRNGGCESEEGISMVNSLDSIRNEVKTLTGYQRDQHRVEYKNPEETDFRTIDWWMWKTGAIQTHCIPIWEEAR